MACKYSAKDLPIQKRHIGERAPIVECPSALGDMCIFLMPLGKLSPVSRYFLSRRKGAFMNPFEHNRFEIGDGIGEWQCVYSMPHSKQTAVPYTKIRIIPMNGMRRKAQSSSISSPETAQIMACGGSSRRHAESKLQKTGRMITQYRG